MGLKKRLSGILGPPDIDEVFMLYRLIGSNPGVMIDVGAHQGNSLDPFLNRGWQGYAFEPDPANRAILHTRCPKAVIDPRAVSEVDGEQVPLFTSEVSTGLSTLSPFHRTHTPTTTVETVRLDTYIQANGIGQVDLLKSDVEGFDLAVLRTFPWKTHLPKAVVCEFEDRKTKLLGHNVHDIARYLQRQGYAVLVSEWEPIVEYGSRHKWKRFAQYPVDLASDSWGNLIAVEPSLRPRLEKIARATPTRARVRRWIDRARGVA